MIVKGVKFANSPGINWNLLEWRKLTREKDMGDDKKKVTANGSNICINVWLWLKYVQIVKMQSAEVILVVHRKFKKKKTAEVTKGDNKRAH